jgi:SpoVK/Ycf46/Vps4 family AAA+-type ATPase
LAALDAYEGLAILSTNIPTALDPALDRRVTLQIDFDIPSAPLREKIWRLHIPDQLMLADDVDLPHLAEKYEFAGGTIRNAIAVAMNRALADAALNGSELVLNMAMLDDAAKTQIRNKIKKLADKTRTTLTLDDLVLPRKLKEQLRSIIAAVRNRRKIFEEWGFGEKLTTGRGLCVLFRGDSGTGKTLSAEIIANELGMTLYRVRIPAIVSKYVGETEKNLEKCFREAAASGALLLFDEADSIFSKRTEVKDANDRYSNMEVNLLLQEVERFQGVVILTTNLDAAIDDAFERRLNHKLDFPFPEARDRARIWKRLLPKQAPLSDDIDFEALGRDFDLAGGNIKNAVIRAAYQAAEHKTQINMDLLEACGLQEYREMGKLVPNRRNPWD